MKNKKSQKKPGSSNIFCSYQRIQIKPKRKMYFIQFQKVGA